VQRSTKYRNRSRQCAFIHLAFRQRAPRAGGTIGSCALALLVHAPIVTR